MRKYEGDVLYRQMRRLKIILILAIPTCLQANAQLILTEQDNLAWTSNLRSEKDAVAQFEIIRARLLADTNVYVKNFGDRSILKTGRNKEKFDAICRPLIIVGGQFINITNDTDTKEIKKLTAKLMSNNFKEILILEDNQATALYGKSGICGAIVLTPKNKKVQRDILKSIK